MGRGQQGSKRRNGFWTALLGAVVGGVVVSALPAVAGVGDTFTLGRENKGGGETTELSASVADGPGLKVTNSAGDSKAAVRINTDGTAPPFATNSDRRVLNFNADKLDDLDAVDLGVLVAGDHTENAPDPAGAFDVLTTSIEVPSNGHLVVNASVAGYNLEVVDRISCSIELDDEIVPGSERALALSSDDGGLEDSCASSAFAPVSAGATYEVAFAASSVAATTTFLDASLSVLFVPDGASQQ